MAFFCSANMEQLFDGCYSVGKSTMIALESTTLAVVNLFLAKEGISPLASDQNISSFTRVRLLDVIYHSAR